MGGPRPPLVGLLRGHATRATRSSAAPRLPEPSRMCPPARSKQDHYAAGLLAACLGSRSRCNSTFGACRVPSALRCSDLTGGSRRPAPAATAVPKRDADSHGTSSDFAQRVTWRVSDSASRPTTGTASPIPLHGRTLHPGSPTLPTHSPGPLPHLARAGSHARARALSLSLPPSPCGARSGQQLPQPQATTLRLGQKLPPLE